MNLELTVALAAEVIKCPKCGEHVNKTEDYKADLVDIPQIGGPPTKICRSEEVTLFCSSCDWSKRTTKWKSYIKD